MSKITKFNVVLLLAVFITSIFSCALLQRVSDANLDARYYSTREGVTKQIFPESDWPCIIHMNEMEPKTQVVDLIWVSYDASIVIWRIVDEVTGSCDAAGFHLFPGGAELTHTEDWQSIPVFQHFPIDCEELVKTLDKALKEGNI